MLAAPKMLHTLVRLSACVHGAAILMPGHVHLARLGCWGPGTPKTDRLEKRVMPPLDDKTVKKRKTR